MRSFRHAGTACRGPACRGPDGGGPGALRLALGFALLLLAGMAAAAPQESTPEPEPAAPEPSAPQPASASQSAGPQAAESGFQVVVHRDVTVTRLPAKTVANMFLKKSKRWETGEMVVPVDLEPRHPVRRVFTRAVHKKSITAIQSFWQRIIFSGRGSPPATKASEQEVLDFVAANPGAIGYVSAAAELRDGVRVLAVDDLRANE